MPSEKEDSRYYNFDKWSPLEPGKPYWPAERDKRLKKRIREHRIELKYNGIPEYVHFVWVGGLIPSHSLWNLRRWANVLRRTPVEGRTNVWMPQLWVNDSAFQELCKHGKNSPYYTISREAMSDYIVFQEQKEKVRIRHIEQDVELKIKLDLLNSERQRYSCQNFQGRLTGMINVELSQPNCFYQYLSDCIRYAILFSFGGVYMDVDIEHNSASPDFFDPSNAPINPKTGFVTLITTEKTIENGVIIASLQKNSRSFFAENFRQCVKNHENMRQYVDAVRTPALMDAKKKLRETFDAALKTGLHKIDDKTVDFTNKFLQCAWYDNRYSYPSYGDLLTQYMDTVGKTECRLNPAVFLCANFKAFQEISMEEMKKYWWDYYYRFFAPSSFYEAPLSWMTAGLDFYSNLDKIASLFQRRYRRNRFCRGLRAFLKKSAQEKMSTYGQ